MGPKRGGGVMGVGPQGAGRWAGLAWPGVGRQRGSSVAAEGVTAVPERPAPSLVVQAAREREPPKLPKTA